MADERRFGLLAIGDPCLDLLMAVDALPRGDDKVMARPLGTAAGGTTANAACAFARLGGRAAVHGRVGDDAFGTVLRESLRAEGVDVTALRTVAGLASGVAVALLPPGGERALVVAPMGPDLASDPALAATDADSRSLRAALGEAREVYAMPYDLAAFEHLHQWARASGTRIAIDLEPAVAADAEAMRRRVALADTAFFNEAGFRAATGQAPDAEAVVALLDLGPSAIVVSLGAAGAIAADRGGVATQPGFPVEVVDTTGAGDCFNAAFLLARQEGQSLPDSLRLACAAGALAVTALGARAGVPSRAALDQWLSARR